MSSTVATPYAEQLKNVNSWSKRYGWALDEAVLNRASSVIPNLPVLDETRFRVPVLVPYLASVEATFEALWTVVASCGKSERDSDLRSEPGHLRLLPPIEHRPGLRWEVIGLQDNRRESPATVRGQASAHAGVLAAAAHFPAWLDSVGSRDQPEVILAGYQVSWFSDDPEWTVIPWMMRSGFRRKTLEFNTILATPPNTYNLCTPQVYGEY